MLAFLTGQLQHQGYERGSSRPAALDLHRVERDLEGGGTSIGEGEGKRRGGPEERCHGGRGREGGRDRFAACLGKVAWAFWWSLGLGFLSFSPFFSFLISFSYLLHTAALKFFIFIWRRLASPRCHLGDSKGWLAMPCVTTLITMITRFSLSFLIY